MDIGEQHALLSFVLEVSASGDKNFSAMGHEAAQGDFHDRTRLQISILNPARSRNGIAFHVAA